MVTPRIARSLFRARLRALRRKEQTLILLDAHARFMARPDSIFAQAEHDGVDVSAAAMTALAKLGGLDDVETDDDLDAAALRGWAMFEAGEFGAEQLDEQTRMVLLVVLEWGRRQMPLT